MRLLSFRLNDWTPSSEKLNHKHDQRQHQDDVNVGSKYVETNPAQKPEDQQNYKNCPKHDVSLQSEVIDYA